MEKYYCKSTYTGQCYALPFIPPYDGFETISQSEYEEHCIKTFGKII